MCAKHTQRSPIAIMGKKLKTENLTVPENLVMTLAYTVHTNSGSRGKKLCKTGKRVPDMYIVFHFGAN